MSIFEKYDQRNDPTTWKELETVEMVKCELCGDLYEDNELTKYEGEDYCSYCFNKIINE